MTARCTGFVGLASDSVAINHVISLIFVLVSLFFLKGCVTLFHVRQKTNKCRDQRMCAHASTNNHQTVLLVHISERFG